MRLCVFEDAGAELLEPLTLTRPAFELWCGSASLFARQRRHVPASETGVLVRSALAALCRLDHPDVAVNDCDWLRRGPAVFVNGRWLPPMTNVDDWSTPRIGLAGQHVVYVVASSAPEGYPQDLEPWLDACKKTLPHVQAGGTLIDYLWDIVDQNPLALVADLEPFHREHGTALQPDVAVVGPRDRVIIADGALVEPYVVADTRQGPVLVERGAVIHAFSRLEGPCYVGRDSWVLGAKFRGGSIGPNCRIGGEVEASIMQGYSNKYHEGFLGHSYVGSWVNLAAGTQTSDLRNDYGMIKVPVACGRVASGRNKVGSYIGDHTKTALGTLFNTGTAVGAFCNVLSSASLAGPTIPSFCQYNNGQVQERWDLRQLFQTAHVAMRRRGCEFSDAHKDFYFTLYDQTAPQRARMLQVSEHRRLRRSV